MRTVSFAVLTLALVAQVPSAKAGTLFTSGPFNGEISGWDLTTFSESNSFTLSAGDTVTGADFAAWLVNGSNMTSVNWAIQSTATGGTTFASGSATPVQAFLFADSNPGGRSFGFDIDNESFSIPAWVAPTTGTYWLALSNAATDGSSSNGSDKAYWDENDNPAVSAWSSFGGGGFLTSGFTGCSSPSCSETFEITGDPAAAAVPEPGSFALATLGMLGVAIVYRRRHAAK